MDNITNIFTRDVELYEYDAIDHENLSNYNGMSVQDMAAAIREAVEEDIDCYDDGIAGALIESALDSVDWHALAIDMFDELVKEAPAFRFTAQYGNAVKLPYDTTHQNPREWAKENGYTVKDSTMTNPDFDLLFFVLEFPED